MEERVSLFSMEVLKIASRDCYFPSDIWDILILIRI